MNPPQVYMCSPSWTLLPPPSPFHPSGSSQCTSSFELNIFSKIIPLGLYEAIIENRFKKQKWKEKKKKQKTRLCRIKMYLEMPEQDLARLGFPCPRVECACSVTQLCLTLCDTMAYRPLGSSVHGIFRQEYGVGCHFLLQGIFPTQGLNLHLLHWQVNSLLLSHLRRLPYPSSRSFLLFITDFDRWTLCPDGITYERTYIFLRPLVFWELEKNHDFSAVSLMERAWARMFERVSLINVLVCIHIQLLQG